MDGRRWRHLIRVGALAACLIACSAIAPRPASASSDQQTLLMDDGQLIYSSPAHVTRVMKQLAALGVSTVKVSVVWSLLVPDPNSRRVPRFDASDPDDYPMGAWDRYDLIDTLAQQLGMNVDFLLAPPAPRWAIPAGENLRQGPELGHAPSLRMFQQFVEAVGRRYDGSEEPKVSMWGIWNEPNERSWLNPEFHRVGGHIAPDQPALYRGLADAAWRGLVASGHANDTILIGETANVGTLTPLTFTRDLFCVGQHYQPLEGTTATRLGCPATGTSSQFAADNPGLFEIAGFSHHPYGFDVAPNSPYPARSFVTLANLGTLENALDRIDTVWGRPRKGGLPIYVTEWGYKTNPPNPFARTSLATQAAWLDEGDYMTWRDPFVRSIAQFLLVDSPPKPDTKRGSAAYWSTFQTGLELRSGKAKPALAAFRLPIWLPSPHPGDFVPVWAQLRPADHSSTQFAYLQFQAAGTQTWSDIAELQTTNSQGYVSQDVGIPGVGSVRVMWTDPQTGTTYYSRLVAISAQT